MSTARPAEPADSLLSAEFWRQHVLADLMPLWLAHAPAPGPIPFHPRLSRQWEPEPGQQQLPAMISRNVFAFTAAFMLSGEGRYLEAATAGRDYLLQHAWDAEYGGWFDALTMDGEPVEPVTKRVAPQLYTNVGLTLYAAATGDAAALEHVQQSVRIRHTAGHDPEFGGYYHNLDRQLQPIDTNKTKHAHYGYVGSLLLNLYLGTRDPAVLAFEEELTGLTLVHMLDAQGWVFGFRTPFDRQWRPLGALDQVAVGAQLTAVLSFLRLHHQSGNRGYRVSGEQLAAQLERWGYDAGHGAWLDRIDAGPPHAPRGVQTIHWWNQIYGAFLQLQRYRLSRDEAHLRRFQATERFYLAKMVDAAHGGVLPAVGLDGRVHGDGRKAGPWRTAYHEIEHGLLNYLYLHLYVHQTPATLHFRLDGGAAGRRHHVALVDDPDVSISQVLVDGNKWDDFDAAGCSVWLPGGPARRVQVTYAPLDTVIPAR